jgi:hypothetical protein
VNILSIGNSFSQDAQRYLHAIARVYNTRLYCANLYIGGCSLEQHAKNITSGAADYSYEINGEEGREKVSVAVALDREKWDIVTLQQVSDLSGIQQSYQPYLSTVHDAVRAACPDAKIYLHETWAYEADSTHNAFAKYDCNQNKMHEAIRSAVRKMSEEIDAEIIPTGDAIQAVRAQLPEFNYTSGGISLNRDGFHLSLGYGRYIAGMTWYATLTRKDIRGSAFPAELLDEPVDKDLLSGINDIVYNIVESNGYLPK